VDLRRLRAQEWLVGVCGVALLAATFLDWYGVGSVKRDAWESFGALDVLLSLVGLTAIALGVVTAAHRAQAVPTAIASLLAILGIVVTAWLVYRVASPPDVARSVPAGPRPTGYIPSTEREAGPWIGLAACVGILAGTLMSVRDDRFPRAVREAGQPEVTTLPTPPPEGAGEAGS
jgi:uncharacterized membrane protein